MKINRCRKRLCLNPTPLICLKSRAFQKNSAVIHPRNVTTRAYWLLSLEMKSQGTWIRNPLTNIVTKLSPPTVHLRSHCLSLKVICFPMCAFLPPPRPLLRWYLSPRLSFFFLWDHFYWCRANWQGCDNFCCTTKWPSYTYPLIHSLSDSFHTHTHHAHIHTTHTHTHTHTHMQWNITQP